jgi:hypothetical protein
MKPQKFVTTEIFYCGFLISPHKSHLIGGLNFHLIQERTLSFPPPPPPPEKGVGGVRDLFSKFYCFLLRSKEM